MTSQPAPMPENAFLQRYAARDDCYTDCFAATVQQSITLEQFLNGFYSSSVFLPERVLLSAVALSWTSKQHLADFAATRSDQFSMWHVEARETLQVLLQPRDGMTRSWLMVAPEGASTTLYFGSAVLPKVEGAPLGFAIKSLMGFHLLYSKLLLNSAIRRLI